MNCYQKNRAYEDSLKGMFAKDYQRKDHSKKIQKSKLKNTKKRKLASNKRISHRSPATWNYPKDYREFKQTSYGEDTNANLFMPKVPIWIVKAMIPPLQNIRNEKSLENLKSRFKASQPVDPVQIDVDMEKNQVSSHEGRHRLLTAETYGIGEVPVLFTFRDDRGFRASLEEMIEFLNIPKESLTPSDLQVRDERIVYYDNTQEKYAWTTSNPFYTKLKRQKYTPDRVTTIKASNSEPISDSERIAEELYKLKRDKLRKEMGTD